MTFKEIIIAAIEDQGGIFNGKADGFKHADEAKESMALAEDIAKEEGKS